MSSNLVKRGYAYVQQETPRIIDSAARPVRQTPPARRVRIERGQAGEDGFESGISADVLEALTGESGDAEGSEPGDVSAADAMLAAEAAQRAAARVEETLAEAEAEAEELKRQALEEIEELKASALEQLEKERRQALEEAEKQGYREGREKADREAEALKEQLEAKYEAMTAKLEPQLVEVLTGVYEHIFKVELSEHRDLILYLISGALGKIEGGRNLIVHVSRDDYPYVGMQKQQILSSVSGSASVEIVEDITLAKNEALIETEGGIYDCGLGTQLEELTRKIRLLSYDGTSGDNA